MAKVESGRDLGQAQIRGAIGRRQAKASDFLDKNHSVGKGLKMVGAALDDISERIQRQQETKRDIEATKLIGDLDRGQKDRAANMEPGAVGFLEAEEKELTERVSRFIESVPRGHRQKYEKRFATAGETLLGRAQNYQEKEIARYEGVLTQEALQQYENSLDADPDSRVALTKAGDNQIKNSNLSPIAKDAALRDWKTRAGFTATNSQIKNRPGFADTFNSAMDGPEGLIKSREGFRNEPYDDGPRDSNGKRVGPAVYRAGYGSDTYTTADGKVHKVTKLGRVSRADAERDLKRRIGEFQSIAIKNVGEQSWNRLPNHVKSVLTSITYNYGRLPQRIRPAVQSGDSSKIANAILTLADDNGGINRDRREEEAALIGSADGLDVVNLNRLQRGAQQQVSEVRAESRASADQVLNDAMAEAKENGGEHILSDEEIRTIENGYGEASALMVEEINHAGRTRTITKDFVFQTETEIENTLIEIRPREGDVDFARRQKTSEAAEKEFERIQKLRDNDPASAVSSLPEVEAAFQALDPNNPETIQAYSQTLLNAQAGIGILKDERAPITRRQAEQLFLPVTNASGPGEAKVALIKLINDLDDIYGPLTDEVLIYALYVSGLRGETRQVSAQVLRGISNGEAVSTENRKKLEQSRELDAVENATSSNPPSREPEIFDVVAPAGAIEMLRTNPGLAARFDEKYGAGSADKVLKRVKGVKR